MIVPPSLPDSNPPPFPPPPPKAATLAFDKLNGPTGELYSMRIMNADGEKILSILLNYDIDGNDGKPGKYYPGAVDKWLSLRSTYADINGDVDLRA